MDKKKITEELSEERHSVMPMGTECLMWHGCTHAMANRLLVYVVREHVSAPPQPNKRAIKKLCSCPSSGSLTLHTITTKLFISSTHVLFKVSTHCRLVRRRCLFIFSSTWVPFCLWSTDWFMRTTGTFWLALKAARPVLGTRPDSIRKKKHCSLYCCCSQVSLFSQHALVRPSFNNLSFTIGMPKYSGLPLCTEPNWAHWTVQYNIAYCCITNLLSPIHG